MTVKDPSKKRRSAGEGSITQLANGRYKVAFDAGFIGSVRSRRTFTSTSKAEVVAKLNEWKAEKAKGTLKVISKYTVEQYVKRWLSLRKDLVKHSTYSYYELRLNDIVSELGYRKLQLLSVTDFNNFLKKRLADGLSATTVAKYKSVMHNVLESACGEGIVSPNIIKSTMTIPIARNVDIRVLTEDEKMKLLTYTKEQYDLHKGQGNFFWLTFHFIYLGLTTGLRRGELCGLRWSDIDMTNRTLSVRQQVAESKAYCNIETPKTRHSLRTITIDAGTVEVLQDLKKAYKIISPYVFCNRNGDFIRPHNAYRAFKAATEACDIEGVRLHDLRHTHATTLIMNGINVKTVSLRLGHASIQITLDTYTHAIQLMDEKAANISGIYMTPSAKVVPTEAEKVVLKVLKGGMDTAQEG